MLERLNAFVRNGGHIVYTCRSGFADEELKVRTLRQPGIISEACGVTYSMFVEPVNISLKVDPYEAGAEQNTVETWMELLTPITAEVLAAYDHPHWGRYAAITSNRYGTGRATYIGCLTSPAVVARVLEQAVKAAGSWGADQALSFPLITRWGVNEAGKVVRYYFNYSDDPSSFVYPHRDGIELLTSASVRRGETRSIDPWGMQIVEEREAVHPS